MDPEKLKSRYGDKICFHVQFAAQGQTSDRSKVNMHNLDSVKNNMKE